MIFARTLATFFGSFALLNLCGEVLVPGFDANAWWIDLRMLPGWAAVGLLATGALLMLAWAFRPRARRVRRWTTGLAVAALLAFAIADAWRCTVLGASGGIVLGIFLPLSAVIAIALAVVVSALRRRDAPPMTWRTRLWAGALLAALLVAFPLSQMIFFGRTDYRREADAIVVFGAGVHPDGRCSHALADRMRTACELQRAGYADLLILSGGPGMGAVHETEGMRRMALELGVPEEAILLDPAGLNTCATVRNLAPLLEAHDCRRVLAVSHAYHLPRIKLSCDRAGVTAFTVPARESYLLTQMPWYMAREVVALWAYYLAPLV